MVLFCSALILVSLLLGAVWQPGFAEGFISIRILGGDVHFMLGRFLLAALLLLLLLFCVVNAWRWKKRLTVNLALGALSAGILMYLLDHLTYGWTAYSPFAFPKPYPTPFEKLNTIFLSIKVAAGGAVAFLLYAWIRQHRAAPDGIRQQ